MSRPALTPAGRAIGTAAAAAAGMLLALAAIFQLGPEATGRPRGTAATEKACARYLNHHAALFTTAELPGALDAILETCGTITTVAPTGAPGGGQVLVVWTTDCWVDPLTGRPDCQASPEG